MSFSTPPWVPPFTWEDYPSTATILNSANLMTERNALVGYIQEVIQAYATWAASQVSAGYVIDPVANAGAKGDGTTDDTAAIQEAVNAITGTSTGAPRVLDLRRAPKSFLINEPILLPDNVGILVLGKRITKNPSATQVHADITCGSGFSGLAAFTHQGALNTNQFTVQSNGLTTGNPVVAQGITLDGLSIDMSNVSATAGPGGIPPNGIHFLGRQCNFINNLVVNAPGTSLVLTDTDASGIPTGSFTTDNRIMRNCLQGFGVSGFISGSFALATLGTALTQGATVTSLKVSPFTKVAIPPGNITLTYTDNNNNQYTQTFVTSGAAAGVGTIPVTSATANYSYPVGSTLNNGSYINPATTIFNAGNNTDAWLLENEIVAAPQAYAWQPGQSTNSGPSVALANGEDWWVEHNHVQHSGNDLMDIYNLDDSRVAFNMLNLFGEIQANGATYYGLNLSQIWGTGAVVEGNHTKANEQLQVWANNTYYAAGELITNSGTVYMCTTSHTSPASGGFSSDSSNFTTSGVTPPTYNYFYLSANTGASYSPLVRFSNNSAHQYASGSGTSVPFVVAGAKASIPRPALNVVGSGNLALGANGGPGGNFSSYSSYPGDGSGPPVWIMPGITPIAPTGVTLPNNGSPNTQSYGTLTTILSPLVAQSFVRLRSLALTMAGVGTSEVITIKVTFTWSIGTTTTGTYALPQGASGTVIVPSAVLLSGSAKNLCTLVQAQIKSSSTTSTATCTAYAEGDAGN